MLLSSEEVMWNCKRHIPYLRSNSVIGLLPLQLNYFG